MDGTVFSTIVISLRYCVVTDCHSIFFVIFCDEKEVKAGHFIPHGLGIMLPSEGIVSQKSPPFCSPPPAPYLPVGSGRSGSGCPSHQQPARPSSCTKGAGTSQQALRVHCQRRVDVAWVGSCRVCGPRPRLGGLAAVLTLPENGATPNILLSVGEPPSRHGGALEVILVPGATEHALLERHRLQPMGGPYPGGTYGTCTGGASAGARS